MQFPKPTNYRDKANYNKYRQTHDTCEHCGAPSVDVHHINLKGMGGGRVDDRDSNLIALCRGCHNLAHGPNSKQYRETFLEIKEITLQS